MSLTRKISWAMQQKQLLNICCGSESTDDENSEQHRDRCYDQDLNEVTDSEPCKYKTELCKNYSEMGFCHYYEKCRFAHGYDDLAITPERMTQHLGRSYRTKRCKNFWATGQCLYGLRCQFAHHEISRETIQMLKILKAVVENTEPHLVVGCQSRLLTGLYANYNGIFNLSDEE